MMYEFFWIDSNVKQRKLLISHSIWEEYNSMPKLTEAQEKRAKAFLKYHTKGNQWFTDKSPLYDSISTGILNCNGQYKCIVNERKD